MGIPLRELQQRVSSAEFAEYWAAYRMDPWGEERADLRAAQLAALTANIAGGKRGGGSFTIDDFLLRFGADAEPKRQTMEEQIALAAMITVMTGGEDRRGQRKA